MIKSKNKVNIQKVYAIMYLFASGIGKWINIRWCKPKTGTNNQSAVPCEVKKMTLKIKVN